MFNLKKAISAAAPDHDKALGENLNFTAAEAYRLLRTNLDFSLPETGKCKIIGITSTLRGEGKSTTSVNLAYTLAQTGKKVLLLEADLRLPTAAKRLNLKERPGLSTLLIGRHDGQSVIQKSGLNERLYVITAGDIPPNPAELLNSEQMAQTMAVMAKHFDVILVDLPPVSVVSDGLILSRLLSGMVLVVREGACGRRELNRTVRQLEFAECKILGFVMTGSGGGSRKYGTCVHSYGYGRD